MFDMENERNSKQNIYFIMESIGLTTHKQSSQCINPHHPDYIKIIYIIGGEISHKVNNKEYVHTVGDCIILFNGATHGINNLGNAEWRDIMILQDLFDKIVSIFPDHKFNKQPNCEFLKLTEQELTELEDLAQKFTTESNLICKRSIGIRMILKIFYEHKFTTSTHFDSLPPMIKKICTDLNKEVFLKGGISKILEDSLYSRSYVCHLFKKHMGISLSDYITDARLNQMTYYLINTDYSLRQIADKIGIESLSYLNKIFKRKYNMPPIKYRHAYHIK